MFAAALAALRVIAPAQPKPEPVRPASPSQSPTRAFDGTLKPPVETALTDECAELAGWPPGRPGGRITRVWSAAAQLGELVAGGELPRGLVESSVFDAAVACGVVDSVGEAKVREQIEAGLAQGSLTPRSYPETAPRRTKDSTPEEPDYLREEFDGSENGDLGAAIDAASCF